jgi:hypothetical protein
MNEIETLQKQWLLDLAAAGLSEPNVIHIAICSQSIQEEAREITNRLSEFLRKTLETDVALPNTQ